MSRIARRNMEHPATGARTSALGASLLVASFMLAACGTARTVNSPDWPDYSPLSQIVLSAGDEIEVNFRYWPELDSIQTVRPDGRISLQLIDDVNVTGLTPEAVDEKLTALYEEHLVDPVLTVVVRTVYNQRVYVAGEVNEPGVVQMPARFTLLEAIMEAGGFNFESAEASTVLVIRHLEGKRYVRTVNLEVAYTQEKKLPYFSEPFFLAPSDIVFVPRTKVFRVDQWVEQYINAIIPDIVDQGFNIFLAQELLSSNNNNNN